MRRPWTPEERERAVGMKAAGLPYSHIGLRLGRSKGSISKYFQYIGLAKTQVTARAYGWPQEHDDILRAMLATDPPTQYSVIGERLGRTKNSCIGRADRLGLMRRRCR